MWRMKEDELQYVTNQAGEKTAVILPLSKFQEMLEDLYDLAAVAERRAEPTILHEELLAIISESR
jgi:PHD/YefM family antitoxin component YafN of YafNO toxin-antitoxin module